MSDDDIHSIRTDGGDVEGLASRLDVSSRDPLHWRVLAVLIILTGVDDGQLPDRRHVHRLEEDSLIQRPVAEETDCNLIAFSQLGTQSCPSRQSHAATDDGVSPQVSGFLIGDMHGASLASAVSIDFPHQFSEHPPQVGAFGQAVPVSPMSTRDVIRRLQGAADTHRDGLLSNRQVRNPRHHALFIECPHLLLELADCHHLSIPGEELLLGDLGRFGLLGSSVHDL